MRKGLGKQCLRWEGRVLADSRTYGVEGLGLPPVHTHSNRTAFSLAELIVAIGILVLLFALAGQVFSLTIQSTGQATALTEVNQLIRSFEQSLREDLRHVRPGQSLILIQANPVNAYWTREGQEADTGDRDPANGYNHPADPMREDLNGNLIKPRADMLMFFTARRGTSFVDPEIKANLQQVVYGHAELGDWEAVAGPMALPGEFQPNPITNPRPAFPVDNLRGRYPTPNRPSFVPAELWHLARRSVMLVPNDIPNRPVPPPGDERAVNCLTNFGCLADPRLLDGRLDVVRNFSFGDLVLYPLPCPNLEPRWALPRILVNDGCNAVWGALGRSQLDETPPMQWAYRMGHYLLPHCASFKVEWTLDPRGEFVDGRLNGAKEVYWFDPGQYDPPPAPDGSNPLSSLETAVDTAPLAIRPPLETLLTEPTCHPDRYPCPTDNDKYSLAERFVGTAGIPFPELQINSESAWRPLAPPADGRPNLVVFGAARRNFGPDSAPATEDDEIVPEDVFPSALRITIDVFDEDRRLPQPTRHVMVIAVGG